MAQFFLRRQIQDIFNHRELFQSLEEISEGEAETGNAHRSHQAHYQSNGEAHC